ncbi:DUF1902 domain-containing protein, partial [Klebsiella variicola]|uniref:DUF1902 domain-containing protein n=1 Tax=Klebsiella variicola TaxID=244366 RepID=UPI00195493FF
MRCRACSARYLSRLGRTALMTRTPPEGTVKMGHLIVVRATWDNEADVWTAESSDLPGLVTEASSLDELDAKLP